MTTVSPDSAEVAGRRPQEPRLSGGSETGVDVQPVGQRRGLGEDAWPIAGGPDPLSAERRSVGPGAVPEIVANWLADGPVPVGAANALGPLAALVRHENPHHTGEVDWVGLIAPPVRERQALVALRPSHQHPSRRQDLHRVEARAGGGEGVGSRIIPTTAHTETAASTAVAPTISGLRIRRLTRARYDCAYTAARAPG